MMINLLQGVKYLLNFLTNPLKIIYGELDKMAKKRLNEIFPEKRVVITGAGSGLGRRLALDFGFYGWKVAICDVNKDRCDETLSMVKDVGGDGFSFKCDVSQWEDVDFFAKETEKEFGGVDVVINNAGVIVAGLIEDVDIEDWNYILSINLMGVVYGCKAFVPMLKRQRKGHIVNIASSAGIVCLAEMAQYNVSKAGIISLSETLKMELFPFNIGISCICPTFFKTNLMQGAKWGDRRQMELAQKFFDKSRASVDDISRDVLKAIEKNKMYVITQWDGKILWFFKRICPSLFYSVLSWGYKKNIFEKILKR